MSQKEIIMPLLLQRKKELEKAVTKANFILQYPVDERLEINVNRGHYRYYQIGRPDGKHGKIKKKYLRDINAAKRIADYDYARHVVKIASFELNKIDKLIATYQKTSAEDYYANLHPGRKALVSPLLFDDEEYANLWLSKIQKKHNSYQKINSFQTENNELVRSKSEKIIADKLKLLGVPYVYEKPLYLNNVTKYPDFTALNKRTRSVYYWEHLGMMDSPDYFQDAMGKLAMYSQNGIWPGKNLIITYETKQLPIDVKMVEELIREYLL